jgi:hypothetical protein
MSKKVLGVSWLNGRLEAVASSGSAVSGTWLCPTAVADEADFAVAVAEAVRQTKFSGTQVALVLDHRSLLFHVQETPPAGSKLVGQMLQRFIDKSQFFDSKAVWGRLDLPKAKGKLRFLLALLPEPLVQRLVERCASQGLHLAAIFPLAAVLDAQLRAAAHAPDDTVLLAADLRGALHLLLGQGDGTVLFSRTVATGSAPGDDRIVQEINRTLHFAQQQFGAKVTQLFVLGAEAFANLRDLPIGHELKILASPVPEEPLYFARRVASLSSRLALNLISPTGQAKRRRHQLAAIGIAALFSFSVAVSFFTQIVVRARERSASNAAGQIEAEDQIHAAARILQRKAARSRAFVDVVGRTNDPAVPELFARYLGAVIPDALRLTQLDLKRNTNGWTCRIEGLAREQREGFIAQLEAFEKELRSGLFKLQISESTHHQLLDGTAPPPARPTTRNTDRSFFVDAKTP